MTFAVGETVVYPNHGAAMVEDIETRQIKGEDKTYLVLRILDRSSLVVRVPACNLDLVGVRDVVDKESLDDVFDLLRADGGEEPPTWSRRYSLNADRLRRGTITSIAEVVRDLSRRHHAGHLSTAEGRMLSKARRLLISELAVCGHIDEDQAQAALDEALAAAVRRRLRSQDGCGSLR
jgi:CarD family transcriptional regulator